MSDSEGTRACMRPVAPVWPLGQTEGTDPELRVIVPDKGPYICPGPFTDLDTFARVPSSAQRVPEPFGINARRAEVGLEPTHDIPKGPGYGMGDIDLTPEETRDVLREVSRPAQSNAKLVEAVSQTKATNPKDAVGVRKVPISCVSTAVMSEVGIGMLEGARKYGRHNYRIAGVRASVYLDALWRHIFVQWWEMGEDIDGPSGIHHVSKAIADLMVLRDSMIQENWVDDRPPRSKVNVDDLNAKASHIIDTVRPDDPVEAWTEERAGK